MNIKPKKTLGQNWLVNPHILDKVVSAAEISKADTILEVGPGTGNLTKKLAEKAGKVIAIEKDSRLVDCLKNEFSTKYAMTKSVEIVEGDILKIDIEKLSRDLNLEIRHFTYKVVGNIPYYITSNFLRTIFESAGWRMTQPKLIVLTVQKEVARRIMARPPHMNLLALSVQYYSEPEIIGYISKNNFRPVPKIDSAIIKLKPKNNEHRNKEQEEKLFALMRIGFSEKRKQLAPILSKKLKIPKDELLEAFKETGIKETARAENLSPEQWENLHISISE